MARDQNPVAPSAALVKAFLVNGAVPVKGQFDGEVPAGANNVSGFGRVDVGRSVAPDVRLGIVRTMLMASPGFRDLVREHSARRVIRLIPVSAVGHDFAYLDGSGTVRKKPGGTLQPQNVDLPLASVVPDVLHQIELSLDAGTRQAIMREARRHTDVGPLEALTTLATFIVRVTGRTLASGAVGLLADAGLALLLDQPQRPDHRVGRLAAAETRADQIILARRKVIRALHHRVGVLEARYPSSVLGDGGVS